jgi:hypothetical protein
VNATDTSSEIRAKERADRIRSIRCRKQDADNWEIRNDAGVWLESSESLDLISLLHTQNDGPGWVYIHSWPSPLGIAEQDGCIWLKVGMSGQAWLFHRLATQVWAWSEIHPDGKALTNIIEDHIPNLAWQRDNLPISAITRTNIKLCNIHNEITKERTKYPGLVAIIRCDSEVKNVEITSK